MKRKIFTLLIAIMMLAVLIPNALASQTAENLTEDGAIDLQAECCMDPEEYSFLCGLNKLRADAGFEPITTFEKMQTAADIRISEITQGYSSTRPDGSQSYTVIFDVGLSYLSGITETWGTNYTSGAEFAAGFDDDIEAKYTHAAVGYAKTSITRWYVMRAYNSKCSNSGFELVLPSDMTFATGTSIEKMCLLGKTTCAKCGTSYFPIISEYCSEFDPVKLGKQSVTVTCFGISETFEVTIEPDTSDPDMKPEELEMLQILNRERITNGLDPVTSFPLLQKVGDVRSAEISEYMSHNRPDGSSCYTVLDELNVPPYRSVAENICAGQSTATEAMRGFMNSSAHRSNILNKTYMHIGLGYHYAEESRYGYYWSQMFYYIKNCKYSAMVLDVPQDMTFYPDTSIDKMGVLVRLYCDNCDVSFMPLNAELCTGYEPAKSGEQTITVNVFGLSASFKVNILEHDHTFTEQIYAPQCVSMGYTEHTCSVCGYSYRDNYTPAPGHNYRWYTVTAPTPTTTGVAEAVCYTCYSGRRITLPLLNDENYSYRIIKEPTCSETGIKEYTYYTTGGSLSYKVTLEKLDHTYESALTEPTCTENGFTTYTCSACGDSYTADEVEAPGHAYVYADNGAKHAVTCKNCDYSAEEDHKFADGSCICGAVESTDPIPDTNLKFNMDIVAGAEMVVNYNFMASVVSRYEDFYLEVSKNIAGGDPIITTYDAASLGSITDPATGEALLYNAAYTGINAKEMGDSFATTLYAIDVNGRIFKGETVVRSIKDFLMGKLTDTNSIPELKTMAVDMLKYGAAAQVNFNYNTENLVIADLTDDQLALATQNIPEAVDCVSVTGEGAHVSTYITVNSKVELNLSCIAADQTDVKCIIADKSGKVLAELAPTNKAEVLYSAVYDNVGAKEMREVITATFVNGNGDAISQSVNWSVESYVAQTRARTDATETEIAMVNAMLTYGDSVAAYMAT